MEKGTDYAKYFSPRNTAEFLNYYTRSKFQYLQRFYPPNSLTEDSELVLKASDFLKNIATLESIPFEEITSMSCWFLFDIVLLIDNSLSILIEEDGALEAKLKNTAEIILKIGLASRLNEHQSIPVISTNGDYDHMVEKQTVKSYLDNLPFEGLSCIGTALKQKVLDIYVKDNMCRPLLVIIITDGIVEGESKNCLKQVLLQTAHSQLGRFASTRDAAQDVVCQFVKIGDDLAGSNMLLGLDRNQTLAPYLGLMQLGQTDYPKYESREWDPIALRLFNKLIGHDYYYREMTAAKERDMTEGIIGLETRYRSELADESEDESEDDL